MSDETTTPTTKKIPGQWLVWRVRDNDTTSRNVRIKHLPRRRHESFEDAEKEAHRLSALKPQSTFLIIQELATVKIRENT